MKRYILFGSRERYYGEAGWHAMLNSYDSVEEAARSAAIWVERLPFWTDEDFADDIVDKRYIEWWHVVDIETGKIVLESEMAPYGHRYRSPVDVSPEPLPPDEVKP